MTLAITVSLLIFLCSLPTPSRFIIIPQDSQHRAMYTLKPLEQTNCYISLLQSVWNNIPMKLCTKNITPFKRELRNWLLKQMEIEEMNVDLRCTKICKYCSVLQALTLFRLTTRLARGICKFPILLESIIICDIFL